LQNYNKLVPPDRSGGKRNKEGIYNKSPPIGAGESRTRRGFTISPPDRGGGKRNKEGIYNKSPRQGRGKPEQGGDLQ